MKTQINLPSKKYLQEIKKIIYGKDIDIKNKSYDFNAIRRAIYNNENLQNLINLRGINNIIEISSGTSDRLSWKNYKDQIINDLRNNKYYREYTVAKGNSTARKAIAYMESLKLNKKYSADDICFTEGATGAITCVFEFFKQKYPKGEVVIPIPNYYIYKFASEYFRIKYKEVYPLPDKSTGSFISTSKIIKNISEKTKLIILTNPANPSGEIYQAEDLLKLFKIAKEKNIFILVDELFAELVFSDQIYICADEIASKLNFLNNLIIVKGYSKTKNFPGLRIGYVLSKNREIINAVSLISQQRQCFPVASNFTGLICFDAYIQSLCWLSKQNKDLNKNIQKILKDFADFEFIQEQPIGQLRNDYYQYQKYLKKLLQFYSNNYDNCLSLLKDNIDISLPKQSAFNTFVKIKGLDKVNMFDFLLNLYITCGVKIEIGSGFGLDQKTWENTPNLGFWLRITFAKNKDIMTEGINKFLNFKKVYLANQNKFLKTNLYF